ncbi:thioesterase II family protein [Ktedonobacter robiniae]|uniref:Thioesterase n=1 Tax=Ktedonobacter robiniae TaxID=2778365 RepID=A0ABQ3UNQ6_9CHLR|nr:alpha/beta fold hydrolase [Ktedonobacter robiniae]GHO54369.1 thioesterase [Ktedonobacter robiniae]
MASNIETSSWITCTQDTETRLRLFCFPYAGGGVAFYRRWSTSLPHEVALCPVYLPGHEQRIAEPAFTSLEQLVATLIEVMQPYLHEPFAFFGHSMGGLIAYVLARTLQEQCLLLPRALCLSAIKAPHLPARQEPLHTQPLPGFLRSLYRLGGTPLAVLQNAELMRLMLPTLRADFTLYETYTHTPSIPLTCPIVVYGGMQDTLVSRGELEGWRSYTSASCTVRQLPGNHFYLHSVQDLLLPLLAQDLLASL